jgi:hypothetical protein
MNHHRRHPAVVPVLITLIVFMASTGLPAWATPTAQDRALLRPSQAQSQAKVQMTVRAGYGDTGAYVIGRWFPVRVTLTNPAGGPAIRVRIEASSGYAPPGKTESVYIREVDLPAPSRKEVLLYAYMNEFARTVEVRAIQGSTVIGTARATIDPVESGTDAIVAVISQDVSALNALNGESIGHIEPPLASNRYGGASPAPTASGVKARVVHLTLDDLPPLSPALDGIAVMVIDGEDTGRLQEAQRQALAGWIAEGGMLVVAVRPGDAGTLAGLSGLVPVTLSGTRDLPVLDSLSELVMTPITITAPVAVPVATFNTGPAALPRVLADQNGVPLVAVMDVGAGKVVYLALSPTAAPLKGWDGLIPLFRRILIERPLSNAGMRGNMPMPGGTFYVGGKVFDTYGTIFSLPGLQLPEPMLIGLFLGLYVLVIGPINFIVLRRIRRVELAWVTVPALTLLFSVAAYLLAYQAKGGDLVSIRASVMHTLPAIGQANATHYLGIFSPVRGNYTAQLDAEGLIYPFNDYGYGAGNQSSPVQVWGGNPTVLREVRLNTWTLQGFVSSHTINTQPPLEAELHLGDNVIEGTIRNRTGTTLHDVALVRGNAVQYAGDLAPGQTARVRLDVSASTFTYSSPRVLLPLPPGVQDPVSTAPGISTGTGNNSEAQLAYNRRVELLNLVLPELMSDLPPDDMDVLALAWGPEPPDRFYVSSHRTSEQAVNLWTGHLPVVADGQTVPRLKAGLVPCTVYVPDSAPGWITDRASQASNPVVAPYVDVLCRLPAGTRPQTLKLNYRWSGQTGSTITVRAYNTRTGRWDIIDSLHGGSTGPATVALSAPADYVGPAGDVTLRLLAGASNQFIDVRVFDLILNE